jgi:hypothetical protein
MSIESMAAFLPAAQDSELVSVPFNNSVDETEARYAPVPETRAADSCKVI